MVIVVGDVQLVRMLLCKFPKFTLVSVVSYLFAFAKKNNFVILFLFFNLNSNIAACLPTFLKFNLI